MKARDDKHDVNPDLTSQEMDELHPAVLKLLREIGAEYPCVDQSELLNQVDCLFAMARRTVSHVATNAEGPTATITPATNIAGMTTNAARPRPDSIASEPEVISGGTSGAVAAPSTIALNLNTTQEERDEWRKQRGSGYTSAVGEYTPEAFWDLLNDVDDLVKNAAPQANENGAVPATPITTEPAGAAPVSALSAIACRPEAVKTAESILRVHKDGGLVPTVRDVVQLSREVVRLKKALKT